MIDAGGTIERAMVHGRLEKNMTQVQTMEHGLAKLHLEPKDIDTVIFTHLHWDHVEMARQFVKARFIVQKEELDFAFRPHDVAAAFYDKELFEGLDFHTIEGDCEIADGVSAMLLGQNAAVTGRQARKPPAVAAGGAESGEACLCHDDAQCRIGLLEVVGGPQAGQSRADDAHVGVAVTSKSGAR